MAEKPVKNNGFIAFLGGVGARAAAFRGSKAVNNNGFLMFFGGSRLRAAGGLAARVAGQRLVEAENAMKRLFFKLLVRRG